MGDSLVVPNWKVLEGLQYTAPSPSLARGLYSPRDTQRYYSCVLLFTSTTA